MLFSRRITFTSAIDVGGAASDRVRLLGLLATEHDPNSGSGCSRVAASAFLKFLPMLPSQILLNKLGFAALPIGFFAALSSMVVAYLVLIKIAKKRFYASMQLVPSEAGGRLDVHKLHRRAARFSHGGPL